MFFLLLVVVAILAGIAGIYVAVVRALPDMQPLGETTLTESTKVYADSQPPVLLAELHGPENREVLSGEEIPQVMRDAVVAVEDSRFYEHKGVDFWGILRAL
ncbi:MAG: transglycosylase domain-containing protein, partial [Anaerolineae bacterium]